MWQLQHTIVVGTGITLLAKASALHLPAADSSDNAYGALERSNEEHFAHTNKQAPLFHSNDIPPGTDRDAASFMNDTVRGAKGLCAPTTWLDQPVQTLKDHGKVVLSCVSLIPARNGKAESVKQIGTALSIQGASVWVSGITIYGCADTAVNISGKDAYLQVRLHVRLRTCSQTLAACV
jgi:hypothetical protein